MKESTIENKVCKYAEEKGFTQFKLSAIWNAGVPDRLFLYNGTAFFVEFKTKIGKLSKLQQYTINSILNNNISVYIINSVKEGIQLINTYLELNYH
jgi:hypothetical protein